MNDDICQVRVNLAERSYRIIIGYDILPGCLAQLREISPSDKVLVISDRTVYDLYGTRLESLLRDNGYEPAPYVIPPGEESKSWDQAGKILEVMLKKNLERKTIVLALGGGVVGDLAGFAAALYRRGVPLIQIPTTLLAQVDSSVGGKVAVNHPLGKNMFGTFYQPAAVWADLDYLETLSIEEWSSGLAEVVKYAVIRDRELFRFLEEHQSRILLKDRRFLPAVIERCCRIKADIVSRDERDEGLRNILNFGHTFGHALESATMYKKYRHGEAVSIGMAAVFELARLMDLCTEAEGDRVVSLLMGWKLPVKVPAQLVDDILNNLHYDKKASGRQVAFILPQAIGKVLVQGGIPGDLMRAALFNIAE